MINSRNIDDLLPQVASRVKEFMRLASAAGIDLLVTSTYRDNESQDALYAQGRTVPGKVATNARSGQSFHNYRCAVDVVPIRNGKPVWDAKDPIWQTIGKLGKQAGLEWAGDWKRFKEMAHFQYTGKLTLAQLISGQKITQEIIVTNFKIERESKKEKGEKHYVVERETAHKEEMRRIANLEKELKHHEKLPMSKAHKSQYFKEYYFHNCQRNAQYYAYYCAGNYQPFLTVRHCFSLLVWLQWRGQIFWLTNEQSSRLNVAT